ncbi:MAG TPA: prolyl oligopeptidase family serine peptidase [Gammaproteobacteria bacterium]|nr:prolyl oligopeptidase family serine peptidase [Gammaproteobacteria bacterium]
MPPSARFALVSLGCLIASAAPAAGTQPPPSPQHPASSTLHGVKVSDPYRWLEDGNAPAVRHWIKAQNAHTDAVLSAMPQGHALRKRVRQLAITSTQRYAPLLVGDTLFYLRQTPPQPQPVLVAQAWPNGKAQVLVDVNGHGRLAITGYWPSPSGRYLAYGTAEGGSEMTTIHVLDVKTGKRLTDTLRWAGGGTSPNALAWDADEKGFIYMRFPPPPKGQPVSQFNAELVHHTLGQPAGDDAVVFGKHYSPIAEYHLLSSPDAKQLALLAYDGDGGPADVFLHRRNQWAKVLGHDANVRGAAWVGQRLLVQSFAGAPHGKIVAVDADGKTHVVLRQSKNGAVQRIEPIAKGFLVVKSWGPDWWVEQYDNNGRFVRRLPLPAHGIGVGGIASEAGLPNALISYSGWTLPSRWAVYNARTGKLKTVFAVKPAADYSRVRVHVIYGVSKDGTRVPVTVLSMAGITLNGKRPTILYGYGGFDIPMRPGFIGSRLAWLERGGVYAVANTRGGDEFGEGWHRGGMRLDKQNVFDDFYAAAKALEKAGWTDRDHLGIMGGSNGGLLMGAELTQHPHAFRAVVSMVGIYDMIRHEKDWANGRYNVPEYGSVDNPAQFKATLAYSPLQNVAPHTAYPAVLMTTGVNDPRVAPWQSRKFTAALQNATTSHQPILLLTRMHAGHGVDASFSQRVGDTVIALTFFTNELGLP